MAPKILILGGGISGLSTALALHKISSLPASSLRVHELRASPSTIGGAVNLTPNALRYLAALDVLPRLRNCGCETRVIEVFSHRTGGKLGEISFDNAEKFGERGLRVKRGDLLRALCETWKEVGGEVKYESKAVKFEERDEGVTVTFEDGTEERADCLLGCDGIHSWVRMGVVQPERKPAYTGIATAYGIVDVGEEVWEKMQFETTALYSSRRGSLMLSYCDPAKKKLYLAAVMETEEVGSREGWRVKGGDQVEVRKGIVERFGGSDGLGKELQDVVERVQDWFLYPVHKLPPHGKWFKGRVLLLGDAAHAMPPQGESVGLAIEDAILLSRILGERPNASIEDIFGCYERNRTKRIDEAFDEANFRWETVKDAGLVASVLKEWMAWIFLWWTKTSRDESFAFDVRKVPLVD